MNEHYAAACAALRAATIPAGVYKTARSLLDIDPVTGYVELSHQNTKAVIGTTAWGTVRRHLIILQDAGLIMKWLNHSARIYFVDYPPPAWFQDDPKLIVLRAKVIAGRAKVIKLRSPAEDEDLTNRAQFDHFRAQDDQNRANGDHFDPSTYTHAPALSWVELSNIDLPTDQTDLLNPTQPPTPFPENDPPAEGPPPPAEGREWAFGLLTDPDVDLQPDNAAKIVQLHTMTYIVKHVWTWWKDRKDLKPGVLVYRLLKARRQSRPDPHPGDEFLSSDFWRRQYSRAEDDPRWAGLLAGLPPPIVDEDPPARRDGLQALPDDFGDFVLGQGGGG